MSSLPLLAQSFVSMPMMCLCIWTIKMVTFTCLKHLRLIEIVNFPRNALKVSKYRDSLRCLLIKKKAQVLENINLK